MKLTVFSFGKLRTPGLRESADYYRKIIQPWVALEEVELKPVPVPDKSPATRLKIQIKEAELLTSRIGTNERTDIYLLDETGKLFNTQGWASWVRERESVGRGNVALCIGSSLGFHETLKRSATGTLSLGPQTLSHDLARVVLLEQLYRAWSVVRGHPYHNEG